MSLVPLPGYLSLVLPQCDFMYCTATDQHAVNLRSFRACGLWGRPDLRPKISAKQKRPIATKNRPIDLPHLFNASRLDVQIPADVPASSSTNATESNAAPQYQRPVTLAVPVPLPIHRRLPITPLDQYCEKPRSVEDHCPRWKRRRALRPGRATPPPHNEAKSKHHR